MNRYFDLTDDMYLLGRWHLDDPLTDEGGEPFEFRTGRSVNVRSTPSLAVQVHGAPMDFTLTASLVPVASHRLAEAFAQVAGATLQRIPVRVGSRNGYEILVATQLIRCLDEQRSEFVKWTEADDRPDRMGSYRSVPKIRLNRDLIPHDTHIFRIEGWSIPLIVSGEMMEAARAVDAIGLKFASVD